MMRGEDLARAVLGAKDRYALLSLGSDVELKVDQEGFLNVEDADVRRAYLKISQKIHPDKLCSFPDATRSIRPSIERVAPMPLLTFFCEGAGHSRRA